MVIQHYSIDLGEKYHDAKKFSSKIYSHIIQQHHNLIHIIFTPREVMQLRLSTIGIYRIHRTHGHKILKTIPTLHRNYPHSVVEVKIQDLSEDHLGTRYKIDKHKKRWDSQA